MRHTLNILAKHRINKKLNKLSQLYHPFIPMEEIKIILETERIVLLQEDNTKWLGMLLGNASNCNITIGDLNSISEFDKYTPYTNSVLALSWYRMPSSNYEIVAYLS
jgi:hypothetical protein